MRNRWMIGGIAVGVAMALVLGALSFKSGRTAQPPDLSSVPVQGKSMGAADAPIVLEVFSDYQCPWCARAALDFEKNTLGQYLRNGQVRLLFRDYPFIGLESYWAAVAAGCAGEQNQFWAYHDKLFQEQKGENQGRFSLTNLKQWAQDLSLDTAAFDRCLTDETPAPSIRADRKLGDDRGVNSTPTFFMNGRQINRIPTQQEFAKMVAEELAKKQ